MSIGSIASPLTISICQGEQLEPLPISEWEYETHTRKMPNAMWGAPANGNLKAEEMLIDQCMVGFQKIRHKSHTAPSGPPKFIMEAAFTYFTINRVENGSNGPKVKGSIPDTLPLSPADQEPDAGFPTTNDTLQVIQDTLVKVRELRTSVFQALAEMGVNAWTDGDLSILADKPAANYEASPMKTTAVQ
jgi:hypothetical protein